MEVKKKFEKPQMEVVKLKPANMLTSASCPLECYCDDDCSGWD